MIKLMHGHACDCASNMLAKDSDVENHLNDENYNALQIYCLVRCASLSVKLICNECRRMRNCVDACLEIVKVIKFSPKRETMIEKIKMKDTKIAESHDDLEHEKY